LSEHYTVIFNGENLYSYNMNNREKIIVENLRNELINICDKLDVPRGKLFDGSPYMGRLKYNYDFVLKYKDIIGYYALVGERGVFSLMKGFPTANSEEAKYILLEYEFFSGGLGYELHRRTLLEKEWSKKFNSEYDSRKAVFEYVIKMLKTVFGSFSEKKIAEYTDYLDNRYKSKHWYYDKSKMTFEELD
jgi:hypothetical protein